MSIPRQSSTRRIPGGHSAPASSSRRMAAPASAPSSRSLQRGAPQPQPQNGRGGPPQKDNTQMYVIGGAVGLMLCLGLGFAFMGGEEKVPAKKKEEPKPEVKVEKPKEPEEDPRWKIGSETEQAKRRQAGKTDQDTTGEVDRDKVPADPK